MKVKEAPERLYLSENIYSTYLYQVPDHDDETAVEYTRTDAFIKKAVEWLENLFAPDGSIVPENIKLIEDFKNYLKGK